MATSTMKFAVGQVLKYTEATIDLSTRSWTQSGQGMYYCTGYNFDYAKKIVAGSLINWSARKPILIIPYIYTPNPKVINLMTTDITNATSGQLGIGILYY